MGSLGETCTFLLSNKYRISFKANGIHVQPLAKNLTKCVFVNSNLQTPEKSVARFDRRARWQLNAPRKGLFERVFLEA